MPSSHKHIGKHLECPTFQEKINNLQVRRSLKVEVPSVDLFMLSLPREGLGNIKKFPSGEETYLQEGTSRQSHSDNTLMISKLKEIIFQ
jgi:hypothetical protein